MARAFVSTDLGVSVAILDLFFSSAATRYRSNQFYTTRSQEYRVETLGEAGCGYQNPVLLVDPILSLYPAVSELSASSLLLLLLQQMFPIVTMFPLFSMWLKNIVCLVLRVVNVLLVILFTFNGQYL